MRVCIPLFYESLVYCAFKKYPCLLAPNHKKGLVFWGCHIWSVRFVLSSSRNPCCGCGFGLISISVYDDCTLNAWHSDKKTATHKAKAAGSKFQRTKKHWLEGEGGRTGHREKMMVSREGMRVCNDKGNSQGPAITWWWALGAITTPCCPFPRADKSEPFDCLLWPRFPVSPARVRVFFSIVYCNSSVRLLKLFS